MADMTGEEMGEEQNNSWVYRAPLLCGDEDFFDSRLSWDTDDPLVSVCVQKSLLLWLPCGLLWLLAPLQGYRLLRSKARHIPHSLLNVVKTVLAIGLLILAIADLITFASSAGSKLDLLDPVLRGITWVLVAALIEAERTRGVRNSALLWVFWLVYLLCQAPRVYSQVRREAKGLEGTAELVSNSLTYAIVLLQWILSFFMDSQPEYVIGTGSVRRHWLTGSEISLATEGCGPPSPETSSPFPSIITFSWFDSLAATGYKRSLTTSDLWQLNPRDQSATVAPIFNKNWQPMMQAANLTFRETPEASFSASGGGEVKVEPNRSRLAKENLSIFRPLVVSFGLSFLTGSCLKFIHDIAVFIAPVLLKAIIHFASSTDAPLWRGVFYSVCLLLVAFMQTLLLSTYFYRMYLVGLWVKSALISAIYRKSLTVTAEAKKGSTSGEIVNLMSVDAQKITDMLPYLNMLWSSPLQITVAIYMLYQILGPSVIAGLVVMIVLIPVNGVSAAVTRKLQVKMMKQKDIRVKKMNELLSGMKILKLYAWEASFMQEVVNIRNAELGILLNIGYLSAFISFFWTCAPFVVSLVTFAVYVLSDENNVLDAEKAFTSLALFNILRFPLSMLPMMITSAVQASVSVKRINKFMRSGELDPNSVEKSEKEGGAAITVSDASFNWGVPAVEEERSPKNGPAVKEKKDKKISMNGGANGLKHENGAEETSKMLNGGTGAKEEEKAEEPTAAKAEPFSLQDISLVVPQGSLCAVVGAVGSGKSSLLAALLGEMERKEGSVEMRGRVAYVPQQAWIQNATLKDNILFGSKEESEKYWDAIKDCALTSDLDILPAKDMTEIGEKGINLSGGQKQRVALARAVYSGADLFLLDDPLSAVDSHVGKHIFDRVVGPTGCLKDKTRVLVTHAVTFLPQVDQIVVLRGGKVSEVGTYKELLAQKGDFAEFLVQYLSEEAQTEEGADLDSIKRELEAQLSKDEVVRLTKAASSESLSKEDSKRGSITSPRKAEKSQKDEAGPKTGGGGAHQQYKEETTGTGSVNWRVYLIYFRAMGYVLFSSCALLYMVYQIFSTIASMWVAQWSDNRLPFEDTPANVTLNMTDGRRDIFLGIYGATGFAQAIAAVFASLMLYLATISAGRGLHHRMLDRIMHCPMAFFDTTPQGRILNRFGKDVDVLDGSMPMILRGWITCLFSCIATFLVIMVTTPYAVIPIFLVLTGYYFVQRVYVATSRQLKRLESTSRSPIYSHFGETLAGAAVIRAYGLQQRFIRESEKRVDFNHQAAMGGIIANRWLAVRLETVGNCIIFAAALFAVLGRESLSPGMVGLSVSYALQVTQTLNWLVRMTSEVETNIVTVERLEEYSVVDTEADWEGGHKVEESWPREGKIELEGYSTRYREGLDLVLRQVSATIQGGERVGIVGRTGAGKSSLTLALFRLIEPASGRILIDGVDISKLGLHRLRSRLTIIPQDPVLFSGTLRHNLDPFEQYSDAAVWSSLRQSHLSDFVTGLASGLQHEVSEGGENLSVGQRQLICLARALLRKTKVLVLDEATAAVDLETDDLIQTTIRAEFQGCTIITIAHRLNTVLDYDRILVLKEGAIAELDTPRNLLKVEGGLFKGMCQDAGVGLS